MIAQFVCQEKISKIHTMNVTVSLKHSNQRYTLCGYLQTDLNYHWKNYLYLHMEYNNDRYKNLHYSSAVNLVLFNKNQLNASVSYFCIIFIYTLFNNYNNHNNEKKTQYILIIITFSYLM